MTWTTKANLRGPAGLSATTAAEDDMALAGFLATGGTRSNNALKQVQSVTVRHGADATVPRPVAGQVIWQGWAQPINMDARDIWLEIARPRFNIRSSINWEALWLAEDLTAADGADVNNWPDASGNGRHLAITTDHGPAVPARYVGAAEAFAGRPAVAFDGSPMKATVPLAAQPLTYVVLARVTKTASSMIGPQPALYRATSGPYRANAGKTIELTGSTNGARLFVARFNGVNSQISATPAMPVTNSAQVNGDAGSAGVPAGPLYVGGHDPGSLLTGEIVAAGYARGILPESTLADLKVWAAAYGVQ